VTKNRKDETPLLALLIQYVDLVLLAAVARGYCWFLSKRYLPQDTATTVLPILFLFLIEFPATKIWGKKQEHGLFAE
jgi:hypothetical protein